MVHNLTKNCILRLLESLNLIRLLKFVKLVLSRATPVDSGNSLTHRNEPLFQSFAFLAH